MHYSNGREAKVGDFVRGTGYNVKRVVEGVVVGLTPGAETCNIRVAYLTGKLTGVVTVNFDNVERNAYTPEVNVEYGECKAFVAIDKATGEVLPPAPENG